MSSFNSSALILFSGGQDSATCLAWALDRYEKVETIGFSYGQRHSIELKCRETFLAKLKNQFPHLIKLINTQRLYKMEKE